MYIQDPKTEYPKLEEWHDPFVFGNILNAMKDYYLEVLDYSAEMYIRTAKTGGGGRPINSSLGTWIGSEGR